MPLSRENAARARRARRRRARRLRWHTRVRMRRVVRAAYFSWDSLRILEACRSGMVELLPPLVYMLCRRRARQSGQGATRRSQRTAYHAPRAGRTERLTARAARA
jgi:hypothetical protein